MYMHVKMIAVINVTVKSNGLVKYIVGLMRMVNMKNEHNGYDKVLIRTRRD